MENKIIFIFHRSKRVKAIEDLIKSEHINMSPEDLFNLNKALIFQQMTEADKTAFKDEYGTWPNSPDDLKVKMTLPCPCNLKVDSTKITSTLAINATNFQAEDNDYFAFANREIQAILQNEGYQVDTLSKRNLDCQVFGWFKSLYHIGKSGDKVLSTKRHDSQFADLSKHIISLATSVTENGGSFTIKLPIINSRMASMSNFSKGQIATWGHAHKAGAEYNFEEGGGGSNYFAKSAYSGIESNYFNWLISSNDLLFISFEKLEMEISRGEKVSGDADNFDIDSLISDGVYDMICLVDDVTVVGEAGSAEAHVEITGRDLMKLLIEDGTFFFQQSTTSDPSQVFANEQSYGKQGDIMEADYLSGKMNDPINRIRTIRYELQPFTERGSLEIGYILKSVISKLTNVEVVPDYVFDSWGDDRTKYIDLIPKEEKK